MGPLAAQILISLAAKAPELVADLIAELHKQGKVTPQEVLQFLAGFPAEGGIAFFPSLKSNP